MKEGIFALFTKKQEYGKRFLDFLRKQEPGVFQYHLFTNYNALQSFASKETMEVLMFEKENYQELIREGLGNWRVSYLYLLTREKLFSSDSKEPETFIGVENRVEAAGEETTTEFPKAKEIYFFQSGEKIYQKVLQHYESNRQERIYKRAQRYENKGVEIIGFYSPLSRTGQTSFALTMGRYRSNFESVMYLNMESFSGFESFLPSQNPYDLSDFIYYLRQNRENPMIYLASMIQHLGRLEFLYPVKKVEDYFGITREEWGRLLDVLIDQSSYEVILIDLGKERQGMEEVLKRCDLIYLPVLEDCVSQGKIQEFEEYYNEMISREKREIKFEEGMLQKVSLPTWETALEPRDYQNLVGTQMYEFVEKMAEEEGGTWRFKTEESFVKKIV